MNYGEVISSSWKVFWQHRLLWWLAIAVSLVAAVIGFALVFGGVLLILTPLHTSAAIVAVVLMTPVIIWLYGAMIAASGRAEAGEPTTFRQSLSLGGRVFVKYLFFSIIFFMFTIIAITIALLPVLLALAGLAGGFDGNFSGWSSRLGKSLSEAPGFITVLLTGFVSASLLMVLLVALYMTAEYGSRSLILKGSGEVDAIRSGFGLVRRHLGPSLVLWVIIFGINLAAQTLINFITFPVGMGLGMLIGITSGGSDSAIAEMLVGIPLILMNLLSALASALTVAFTITFWTVAYRRLTK